MRRGKGKKPEESGKPAVPESMTTFADMVTLMLTFFILLCTFAETQNTEYFASGVGSFRRAVQSLGLPGIMMSNTPVVPGEEQRPQNEPSRNPGSEEFWREVHERLIEENPEALRDALLQSLDSESDAVLPSGVRFSNGEARLTPVGKQRLDLLIQSTDGIELRVEVIGFGDEDQQSAADSLSLGIRRARVVASYWIERAGIPPEWVTFSGLKAPTKGPTMRTDGEEVLLRLLRP